MKEYNVFYIDKEHEGLTLGQYLKEKLRMSRNGIIKVRKSESLLLNGERARTSALLKAGDRVEFELKDRSSENILPEYMKLDIVYEDDYLIVTNKKAGIPTHPSRSHLTGTLANGLMYYLMETGGSLTVRPVNRLDKNTSGLVVFAKSSHIQHLMSLESYKKDFTKEYLAIVHGSVEAESGTIDAPIAREKPQSIKRVVREDGDWSVTHYRLLERFEGCSLLNITLETGRTHQIRVHMAHIGHPLLGDELYGGTMERINRQALHAHSIKMLHPINGRPMHFTAELPEDMRLLIRKDC